MPTMSDRKKSGLSREDQDVLTKHVLKYFLKGEFVQGMKNKEPFAGCIASCHYEENDLRNTRESLILTGHLAAIGKGRGRKLKTTERGKELLGKLPYLDMEK